jgi:hypothetical protein
MLAITTPHGALFADVAGWPQKNGKSSSLAPAK